MFSLVLMVESVTFANSVTFKDMSQYKYLKQQNVGQTLNQK